MGGKLCLVHPGRDCCADDGGAVLVSDVVLYDEDRPDSSLLGAYYRSYVCIKNASTSDYPFPTLRPFIYVSY